MVKDPSLPTGVAELLAQSGFAAVPIAEGAGFARVDARIAWLETSIKTAIAQLSSSIVPILAEIRDEISTHRIQLATHQAHLSEHAHKLSGHDRKHVEHAESITGVFKRLTIVEEAIVKHVPVKRRKGKKRK